MHTNILPMIEQKVTNSALKPGSMSWRPRGSRSSVRWSHASRTSPTSSDKVILTWNTRKNANAMNPKTPHIPIDATAICTQASAVRIRDEK